VRMIALRGGETFEIILAHDRVVLPDRVGV
jgi:hypothetical protein